MDGREDLPAGRSTSLANATFEPQEDIDPLTNERYMLPEHIKTTPLHLDSATIIRALEEYKIGKVTTIYLTSLNNWELDFDRQLSGWQFDLDHAIRVLSRDQAQITRGIAGRFDIHVKGLHYRITSHTDKPGMEGMQESSYEMMFKFSQKEKV
jgi:hypothetical protein